MTTLLERPAVVRSDTPASGAATSWITRWLPVMIAVVLVRLLPPRGVVLAAVVCGTALAVHAVRKRSDGPDIVTSLEVLAFVPLLFGRGASVFAGVWLVCNALPIPGAFGRERIRRFHASVPALLVVAVAFLLSAAMHDTLGRIVFGRAYTGVGWMALVYGGGLMFRAASNGHMREGTLRLDARLAYAGAFVLQVALVVMLGRTASAGVTSAFIASTALLVATTWTVRRGERAQTPPAERDVSTLWGLPPVNTVAGLTAIGLAIRLLIERGLWLDEAISVAQAKLPFTQMIEGLRHGDIHPPLHAAVLWVSVRTIGDSALALRMPSILAGTLLIPLLYVAGRDAHNRRAGVMAAALGTFAPLLVWYSQEARMYAILLVFSLAAVWFQVRAIRWGRTLDWLAFGACCALTLWTHYFSVLQVVVQHAALLVAAFRMRRGGDDTRDLLAGWGRSVAVMLMLLAPLAPFALDQLASSAQLGGLDVPSRNPGLEQLSIYAILANSVWALWGYHSARVMQQLVALWPLVMLFVLFLLGRGRPKVMWLLSAVAVVPVVVLFFAGLRLRDLFEVRYFLTTVPVLILIVAQFVSRVDISRVATGVIAAGLLGTMGVALADQQINHRNPRLYDFEGALGFVEEHADGDDAMLYAPRYLDSVAAYYTPDVEAGALMRGAPPGRPDRLFIVTAPTLLDRREPRDRLDDLIRDTTAGRTLVDEHEEERVHVQVWR